MPSVELSLVAPLSGPVIPLEATPDPVFAGRLLGDGLAIEPLSSTLCAPCDGVVIQLHRARHALTVKADHGAEILLHIGIDTVTLAGRGFTSHVQMGDRVRTGQPLVSFAADEVARRAPCLQTMVIVANGDRFAIERRADGMVEAGVSPLMTIREREPQETPHCADVDERSREAVIGHAGGMHARPAALVRQAALPFDGEAIVCFDGHEASARSLISLMALGVGQGKRVIVRASGRQADELLAAVVTALETPAHDEHVSAPPPAPATSLPAGPGLRGVSAAPGLAVGRVFRLGHDDLEVSALDEPGAGVEAEGARLDAAFDQVSHEIALDVRGAKTRGATEECEIFGAHLALLEDPEITATARHAIRLGKSAGFAYRQAVRAQCDALERLGNALLGERAADLRDLERRVLRSMSSATAPPPELFEASIVVADDIGPSDLTRLPRDRLAGLCTVRGGPTSHVAILARALGIPAVVAVGPELFGVAHGAEVLLDAGEGRLDLAPTAEHVAAARAEVARRAARRLEASAAAFLPAVTTDGRRIEVAANIATEADAREAVGFGADGVGLLRTELLFLERRQLPDEEEQREAYQAILDALDGRPAIIRTLDAGNDKEMPALPLESEDNPALGIRGIRLGLLRPDLLDTQLGALLGLRPVSSCRIMLPMIADAGELARVRARLDALAAQRGLTDLPALGVMIEVPSAALLADQLARHADFLSIGTNDLTQYTLAMDRCHPGLAPYLDGLHPAVLRLIRQAVVGAERHGKWVGVCGALASDLEAVPILVGLGVTELSVSPPAVPDVKARVRQLDHESCRQEVERFLELESAAAVRAAVRTRWPEPTAAALLPEAACPDRP